MLRRTSNQHKIDEHFFHETGHLFDRLQDPELIVKDLKFKLAAIAANATLSFASGVYAFQLHGGFTFDINFPSRAMIGVASAVVMYRGLDAIAYRLGPEEREARQIAKDMISEYPEGAFIRVIPKVDLPSLRAELARSL